MPTRSDHAPGTFCWADHQSKDPDAARAFSAGLLGWEIEGPIATLDGAAVAAILPVPYDSEHPAHWNSYVSVEDAGVTVPRAEELGATVVERPFTVGPAGRPALLRDPGGASICLWERGDHAGAGRVDEPGALCWNHLDTPDLEGARRFYGQLLAGRRLPCRRAQERQRRSERRSARVVAVLRPSRTSIRARARVVELGGLVLEGPLPAGPGNLVVVADPAGAAACLYAGEMDD